MNTHNQLGILALEVKDLGKRFNYYDGPSDRLHHAFSAKRRQASSAKWALQNVSFSVRRGECYGIIGSNGSGKSTLLKIICGVLRPTAGSSIVRGRVLGLLELGAGLDPELTGRRNVIASTSLLGFPNGYAQKRMAEIEAFAEIGDFFDLPVKLYSSGMLVRLAFSLYLFLEPDVLVIDEALSVGDHFFQRKCASAMAHFREQGTTVLFVSHSLGTVKALCDRALLLDQGRVARHGHVDEVIAAYLNPNAEDRESPSERTTTTPAATGGPAPTDPVEAKRVLAEMNLAPTTPGSGWRVAGIRLMKAAGGLTALYEMGEQARIEIVLTAAAGNLLPSLTVEFVDRFDRVLTGRKITLLQATRLPFNTGEAIVIVVDVTLNLFVGEYVARISVDGEASGGAARSQPISIYSRRTRPPFYGMVGLPATFQLEGRTGNGGKPASE